MKATDAAFLVETRVTSAPSLEIHAASIVDEDEEIGGPAMREGRLTVFDGSGRRCYEYTMQQARGGVGGMRGGDDGMGAAHGVGEGTGLGLCVRCRVKSIEI
jgi:hypothetical protein